MYHIREFVDGGMLAHQHADLLDDVGSMGTVCMTAEDEASSLPVRRWGDEEFQHAFALAHGQRFAVGTPEGLAALVGGGGQHVVNTSDG